MGELREMDAVTWRRSGGAPFLPHLQRRLLPPGLGMPVAILNRLLHAVAGSVGAGMGRSDCLQQRRPSQPPRLHHAASSQRLLRDPTEPHNMLARHACVSTSCCACGGRCRDACCDGDGAETMWRRRGLQNRRVGDRTRCMFVKRKAQQPSRRVQTATKRWGSCLPKPSPARRLATPPSTRNSSANARPVKSYK
jgi:hypothetical protein